MTRPPPATPVAPISDAARRRSLLDTLEKAPTPNEIRVFAYGSLMTNPCFEFVSREHAILAGYRRGFSMWSVHARGTPEAPGLGLALEPAPGESCDGILFRLPAGTGADDLAELWEREMWTTTYEPVWVPVSAGGDELPALTFVLAPDQPQDATGLTHSEKVRYIASAAGKFGTCRDYLADTVAALQAEGIIDSYLETLLRDVDSSLTTESRGLG